MVPGQHHEGLQINGYLTVFYIPIFLLRRVALVYAALYFTDKPWLQVILLVLVSCIKLVHLGYYSPHLNPNDDTIEILNEIFIMFFLYACMAIVAHEVSETGIVMIQTIGWFILVMVWT